MCCCLSKNFHRCFLYFMGLGVSIFGIGLLVLTLGTLDKGSWLTDVLLLEPSNTHILMKNWTLLRLFMFLIASVALVFGLMTHFMIRLESMVCNICFTTSVLLLLLMTVIIAMPAVNMLLVTPFEITRFCASESGDFTGAPAILQTDFMKEAHAVAKEYDLKMN